MKILITGCAGYIGSMLTTSLVDKYPDAEIIGIDNLMFGQQSIGHLAKHPNFTFINMDVTSKTFDKVFLRENHGFDYIFPLAALVGAKLSDINHQVTKAVNFTHIGQMAGWNPNAHIIYPNTNSGYGVGGEDFCTEESPLNPISEYGKTKCAAEASLLMRGKSTVFRLATVFGPSYRFRQDLLVNDFTARAVFDKFIVLFEAGFRRNYIGVEDVINAFMYAMNPSQVPYGVYNLGLSEANLTKMQLCELIQTHIPDFVLKTDEFAQDPDKRDYIVSNQKIEDTGFTPQVSLTTGIQQLIRFYGSLPRKQFTNV